MSARKTLSRLMNPSSTQLKSMVRDAREQTIRLVADLSDEQLMGSPLRIVNPLLWEIGHVAWFQEKWILRHLFHEPPGRPNADQLYDSAAIAHDRRWDLQLPSRAETLGYIKSIRDRVVERIERNFDVEGGDPTSDRLAYFVQLAIFHEDMHTEAFTYTRQTLKYPAPDVLGFARQAQSGHLENETRNPSASLRSRIRIVAPLFGDAEVPGGKYWCGSAREEPFVFDNEKWIHPVNLQPFAISRAPVKQGEFAEFVETGGYNDQEYWSDIGWQWRQSVRANTPIYWEHQSAGTWLRRHFDRWVPLEADLPMIHVNWFEADAYCRWSGRRLPTETEWELAATGFDESTISTQSDPLEGARHKRRFPWGNDSPTLERANLDWATVGGIDVALLPESDSPFGCRQMIGNVWEWTASDFAPYPGFSADPYQEYSEPWFGGTHKVLRGGAYATRSRMIRNNYRNFYMPDRRDVLAGFRTCRL